MLYLTLYVPQKEKTIGPSQMDAYFKRLSDANKKTEEEPVEENVIPFIHKNQFPSFFKSQLPSQISLFKDNKIGNTFGIGQNSFAAYIKTLDSIKIRILQVLQNDLNVHFHVKIINSDSNIIQLFDDDFMFNAETLKLKIEIDKENKKLINPKSVLSIELTPGSIEVKEVTHES